MYREMKVEITSQKKTTTIQTQKNNVAAKDKRPLLIFILLILNRLFLAE